MGPIRGKGPIHASKGVGGKPTKPTFFAIIRDALQSASGSPAASHFGGEELIELRDFAVRSVSQSSDEASDGESGYVSSPEVVDQGYLVGKGPLPFEPHFPSQISEEGSLEEMLAAYKERLETQMRGHLDIVQLDLTDVSKEVTLRDLPRQINMIKGKEVSAEEYLKHLGENARVMSYSNQNLVAPVATELYMRYIMPAINKFDTGDGIAINYYQNEEKQDCLEAVWLGRIKDDSGQNTLYDLEGRVDVNLETQKATMDWKVLESTQGQKERFFSVRHFEGEGKALHSRVRENG